MSTRGASKRGAPEIDRNNIKRTREAEDDEDRQDDMDDMEDFEEMYHEDDVPSSLPMLNIQDDTSYPLDWKRKESGALCLGEDFTFQQIEIDVSSGKPHETMVKGSDPNDTPHIRLFGLTKEGHSVLAHVHGFMPYLYSECPQVTIAQQPADMWQQPMLPHGMSQQSQKPMSQAPQDQSAASWAMKAHQWAQQRRVHSNTYSQNPSYPPVPPALTGPPKDRMPQVASAPLAPPQHLSPPGVQSEYMHPPPPPPPPPPNYPPPQPHHKDPHYPPYPPPHNNNNYSHDHVLPQQQQQPPPQRYLPQQQQHHYSNFQDPHAKSNPQTGQFESPDELHPPPHIHQTHWDYTEPPLPHHSSVPFPPHEYSPPSEPVPSPPPPPHEYTYRYVPRHHYQQPYGRNKSEERETVPPPQLDNKEIELAAKRMLGDDSDSDSDNYSSNNRRKRVSEEDSLLTRRVYDPNHVYAHTPSEHTSRPSQWGAGPPHPLQQSPPRIHHNLPQEQPPQSFDYGHGFPPPVRHHPHAPPPPSYTFPSEYPNQPSAAPDLYTQGEEDWAASRRVIPAWLRDDLKKLERDRQKQVEKENMESGRQTDAGERQEWKEGFETSEMFGPPLPQHFSQNDKLRFFTSEDSRDKFLIEVLQMTVTEFLLEMTSAEIENVCSNALTEMKQSRAKPMVSYDSSTESSIPEEEPKEKVTPHNQDRGQQSPVSSPDRRHKHRSKSSRHHKRGEPSSSSSSSRSRRRSEKSRSYRSRSRSRSPYKPNRKHRSHHY